MELQQGPVTSTAMTPNPLSNMGMNMNLFSLLTSSRMSANGGRGSPTQKAPSPSRARQCSPPSSSSPVMNPPPLALDLSAPRPLGARGSCSS
ncbi:UNVERIFIED_CONTAM: hypothetical protein GTU68_026313, partial [Idotea baltica]|nr:hypothetical protein [Idotea baltica]